MILFAAQESSALPTLAETQAVAAEVHEDLQQLKPNSILESIKAWAPGLLSVAYRLAIAALIIFIGSRIAIYISHFLKKTFDRMLMDRILSKFLISLQMLLDTRLSFSWHWKRSAYHPPLSLPF